jgi:hypothetical protein
MLHTYNTHNMSKTCITWTQNVFRYHKVKINKAKGRLSEKIVAILFEVIAFTILSQFNIFWISATNMGMVFMGLREDVHPYVVGGSQTINNSKT